MAKVIKQVIANYYAARAPREGPIGLPSVDRRPCCYALSPQRSVYV